MSSVPTQDSLESFSRVLEGQAEPGVLAWFEQGVGALGRPPDETKLGVLSARVQRKFPADPVAEAELPMVVTAHWSLRDVARAVLVLEAFARSDAHQALLRVLMQTGGGEEQQSLLKMLSWLPDPARFIALAVDMCRTNAVPVFAAIANHNPFPAAFFPEPNFNQLVLKAMFVEVPVELIDGLAERVNPELVRMANDFAAERKAAGRSIPPGVALVQQLMDARR